MTVYSYATQTEGRFSPLVAVNNLQPVEPAIFPQAPGSLDWLLGNALQQLPQCENAFQIAVYAPDNAKDLPGMVFLPGGGFISGAGTVGWHDAQRYAQQQQCIVFVVNYRLGLAAHEGRVGGGNLVPQELMLALEWANRHGAHFGADTGNLTLAGQSAGAFWAFALAQLPAAAGLFRRVYLGSLSWQPPMSAEDAAQRQEIVVANLGEQALQSASTDRVLEVQAAISANWAGRGLGLYPTADHAVPANLFDVDKAVARLHVDQVLLTHTATEAAAFIGPAPEQAFGPQAVAGFVGEHFADPESVLEILESNPKLATPKSQMVQAMTWQQIELYAIELADAASAAGKEVTLVRFDVVSPLERAGSAHCFDLPFLFNNREYWVDAPMLQGMTEDSFANAAMEFGAITGSFIRRGVPAGADGTRLDVHSPGTSQVMAITETGLAPKLSERRVRTNRQQVMSQ